MEFQKMTISKIATILLMPLFNQIVPMKTKNNIAQESMGSILSFYPYFGIFYLLNIISILKTKFQQSSSK